MATLSGLTTGFRVRGLQYRSRAYVFNGREAMRCYDGVNWQLAGIVKAVFTPTVAASVSTGLPSGTYRYYVVPVNTKHLNWLGQPVAGLPSAISAEVTVSLKQITVSAIPSTHADPQVNAWYVYRNRNGYYDVNLDDEVQDFYYVGKVTIGTTTFTDNIADDALDGSEVLRFNQAAPPCCEVGIPFGERLFAFSFKPLTTGAATVNTDTTKIDFAGVTIPDGVVGCWFQVAGDDALYRITARTSAQVTLDKAYVGACSSASYSIFRYGWEVYFCDYRDYEAWGPDGEAYRWRREVPGRRDAIAGAALANQLFIFTLDQIYAIYGKGIEATDVKITAEPVFDGLGCVGPDAICTVDNEMYFLSLRGPVAWDGQSAPKLIGEKLGTDWLDVLAADQLKTAAVGTDGRYVWFSVPATGETENGRVYRYDRLADAWWEERYTHPGFYQYMRDDTGKGAAFYGQGKYLVQTERGTRDLAPSGTVEGIVTSATTLSLTQTSAAFASDLVEAYVHVWSSTYVYRGSRRITSNTGTALTWSATGSGGGTLAGIVAGDRYFVGPIWWWWVTKAWEIPGGRSHAVALHVGVDNHGTGKSLRKWDYVDGTIAATPETVAAALSSLQFPVERSEVVYAAKLEELTGADLGLRQCVLERLEPTRNEG